jgi:predicted dinucleotide-binding enzyme
MRLTFLGAGNVGGALARRLAGLGHEVTVAESARSDGKGARSGLTIKPKREAVRDADVVFLAVPFQAVKEVLSDIADDLAGKTLIDCTNPVGPGLSHGLASARSGTSVVAELAPRSHVVKAFTIYGFENLEDPVFPGGMRPAMFLAGDDAGAKATVSGLCDALGFDPLDVGGVAQALHLEHMTLLWVRMVRGGGHSPHLAWAALRK